MRGRAGVRLLLATVLLGGCVYDGQYRVEGGVRSALEGAWVPVEGARLDVKAGRNGSPAGATTGREGRYALDYRFGGMAFLLWGWSDGEPVFSATAPGHRTCSVRLRRLEAEESSACVWVRPCEPPSKGCRRVEFVLEAEGDWENAAATSTPTSTSTATTP